MSRSAGDRVRLGVVDDHDVVLVGVGAIARANPGVIAEFIPAGSVDELLADPAVPDVVLLDVNLADGTDVADSVRRLVERDLVVVLYTSDVRPVPIRRGIRAGARGVALKSDPADTLIDTVLDARAGDFAVSSELAHVLATDETLCARLAPRELEALRLLATGIPKKQLGRWMQPPVEVTTVNTYFNRIAQRYAELGRNVGNVYQALREAEADGHLDR
ncbi:DNA-binding NarL/FixJ family response regulator [Friedmanniella endophytica]|uniref:DNA-binding NarL/FixJ family response regulator n=1 Tax=Microlunatus kandeliicorticis TaxID=1759536 RepID=A0A7W3IV23_9ACTN|nr:response regulator transcription factor [Microlunatus kandeliicorticis]MBA8795799.1 DNA-binding NarL/FixJ family response regulator [Microlunatus kandeliicorticis]